MDHSDSQGNLLLSWIRDNSVGRYCPTCIPQSISDKDQSHCLPSNQLAKVCFCESISDHCINQMTILAPTFTQPPNMPKSAPTSLIFIANPMVQTRWYFGTSRTQQDCFNMPPNHEHVEIVVRIQFNKVYAPPWQTERGSTVCGRTNVNGIAHKDRESEGDAFVFRGNK